jgi:hypothetical protein
VDDLSALDLLFYAADSADDLAKVGDLVPALAGNGALWIRLAQGQGGRRQGRRGDGRPAKAVGWWTTRVVGFSDTLTALRFVRRKALPPA